jgi:hypothetical protein
MLLVPVVVSGERVPPHKKNNDERSGQGSFHLVHRVAEVAGHPALSILGQILAFFFNQCKLLAQRWLCWSASRPSAPFVDTQVFPVLHPCNQG